jgi:hypothetical protein
LLTLAAVVVGPIHRRDFQMPIASETHPSSTLTNFAHRTRAD